ncbi:MAG: SLAC1 family transporter [Streptosporangiaceae bacterium]
MTDRRVPLAAYGIPFGLSGLAGCWLEAARLGLAPAAVGDAVLAIGALAWLIVTTGYLRRMSGWSGLRADLLDPAGSPFTALALIVPMLVVEDGVLPRSPRAGRLLTDLFAGLTVLLAAWLAGRWVRHRVPLADFHPGYLLPPVAGCLIAAAGTAEAGQRAGAEILLALGAGSWLALAPVLAVRQFARPRIPEALLPTVAIEVAPAAVASIACFALDGSRLNPAETVLAGAGLLIALAQVRLARSYLRLRFSVATWAFTFGWAAAGTVALHWIGGLRPAGYAGYAYLVLAAVTALIGGIGLRTLAAIRHGRLLAVPDPPAPSAPSAPSRLAGRAKLVQRPAAAGRIQRPGRLGEDLGGPSIRHPRTPGDRAAAGPGGAGGRPAVGQEDRALPAAGQQPAHQIRSPLPPSGQPGAASGRASEPPGAIDVTGV